MSLKYFKEMSADAAPRDKNVIAASYLLDNARPESGHSLRFSSH